MNMNMNRIVLLLLVIGIVFLSISRCAASTAIVPALTQAPTDALENMIAQMPGLPASIAKLHWFGTSAILYLGSKNIYFDPVMLEGNLPPADIILISHAHSDHADLESLKKINVPGTVLIISPNVNDFYTDHADELGVAAIILKEGESSVVGDISVEAVPAFDDLFHFRSTEGAGFVVSVDGERIYFTGGTRMFPEMVQIESDVTIYPWYRNADILAAIDILLTKVLIPVHAGYSGVKAFVGVYGKEITRMKIVGLEPGPYNP
jgi:L-ascorbate metabolism protein UlaG (beta-lactamase superfamily)